MSLSSLRISARSSESVEIAQAAGPLYIGTLVSWLLMGFYFRQVYHYSMSYKDPTYLRVLIAIVSILEIVQWVVVTMDGWYYLVTIWGDFDGFFAVSWEATTLVLLCGLSSLIIQSYYVSRIWILRQSVILSLLAILAEGIALMQSVTSMAVAGFILATPTEAEVARRRKLFSLWLFGNFVADTLIALCMLWILFRAKKDTISKGTQSLLKKVIVNTVKTGTATSIVAGVTVALLDTFPTQNYYRAPANFLQKIYAISLLTNLNSRQPSIMREVDPDSISLQVRVTTALAEPSDGYPSTVSGYFERSRQSRRAQDVTQASV